MDISHKSPGKLPDGAEGSAIPLDDYRVEFQANWRALFQKFGLDPAQCTCLHCNANLTCRYAYAGFNYSGDCLARTYCDGRPGE